MNTYEIDLQSIIDVNLWEHVQDTLAKMTGTAIITVDFKGIPITKHSCCTDFCSVIRGNAASRKRCYKCDALAGLEAVRLNQPYIYLCHCGIVDVAVPVIVGERYLGAVMFGQVRIPDNGADIKVERLVSEISSLHTGDETVRRDLLDKYNALPEMEYHHIMMIAEFIDSIVKYLVDHAIQSRNRFLSYEWRLRGAAPTPLDDRELQGAADEWISAFSGRKASGKLPVPQSSPIYPALAYLSEHWYENISMSEMAKLCHLSSSYFSKLFLRETGENYTDYVNRQKITYAKKRLRETNDSVTQIATDFGYTDISYFIRVFKKFEGITPAYYRRYNYT